MKTKIEFDQDHLSLQQMSPPKSLDDLLREFDSLQISSPSDRAQIDKAIEANKWAKKVFSK